MENSMSTFRTTVVVLALLVNVGSMFAQSNPAPNKQFGIGVGTRGAEFVYAFSPSIQFGSYVGLRLGDGETMVSFTPNLRILFEGNVNMFLQPGLSFSSTSMTRNGITQSSSSTSVLLDGGLVYYIRPSLGLIGSIKVVDLGLGQDGVAKFGLFGGDIGIEWFFAP